MPQSANIVVIADEEPLPTALSQALEYEDFQVKRVTLAAAVSSEQILDQADGVVVAARNIGPGQWTTLAGVLDNLGSRNVASLVMLPKEHQGCAAALSGSEGLTCVSTSNSAEEIWARLSTIASHRSVIRHLENELARFYRLQPDLAEHLGELDEEVRLASRLQRDFLPREVPAIGPVRLETLFEPCSWVSGDIYDIFRLDEHTIGFYVLDVVGHGVPAALLTIYIKRALQTKKITGDTYELISPEETLRLLNRDLLDQDLSHSQFATICYCTIDANTLWLNVARAGHPYPLLIRSDHSIEEIGQAGALLGLLPEEDYQSAGYQLYPGDKVLVYSDGLEEALFSQVEQGDDRAYSPEFLDILDLDIKSMLSRLSQQVTDPTFRDKMRDDATAVGLEIAQF